MVRAPAARSLQLTASQQHLRIQRGRSALQARIEYAFTNPARLHEAMRHASFVNEHMGHNLRSNERLEFLGDRVLSLVLSERLLAMFPKDPEGLLTTKLSKLVRDTFLTRIGEELNLSDAMDLGVGEQLHSNVNVNRKLLEDAFEALMAPCILTAEWLLPHVLYCTCMEIL